MRRSPYVEAKYRGFCARDRRDSRHSFGHDLFGRAGTNETNSRASDTDAMFPTGPGVRDHAQSSLYQIVGHYESLILSINFTTTN